ncbi:hypothetical protein PCANC_17410 [Puccinia coronata f. sp. avenae]|uniref:V-ATPase proteolipid subunit C-like domain-containing protein n=1 Tax=Puccinia coronata f. sp. avenae TaxID=200324 RepID=A0A2N5SCM9_9BASI|nr:hypothetical protein PCANC_17410 [Puccinia coronata f. sp. avenae]
MGCTAAIVFTCIGASYGTSKAGVGISAMGVLRPDLMMKCIIPVVMAGIIAICELRTNTRCIHTIHMIRES